VDPRTYDGVEQVGAARSSTLVAIGNFDGVHRGHRAVLELALAQARARSLAPLILTFHPHPHVVFGRGDPLVLTPLPRKVELLQRLDPSLRIVVEPFTRDLATLEAEAFVERVLVAALGAAFVVVGPDFRFGRGRAGDLACLRTLGARHGFVADAPDLLGDVAGGYSSTRIRRAIAAGDVAEAEQVLGRPHALTGRVVHGDGRGRELGAPTANLAEVVEVLPVDGVYACLVDRGLEGGRMARLGTGVINVGVRPTRGAGRSVEVHVHDLDRSLYGERLRVHLVARLREERRFAALAELTRQIALDIAEARIRTAGRTPDPAAAGAWH
jgi:riboflavin kinase/FMN adenylyltransferase